MNTREQLLVSRLVTRIAGQADVAKDADAELEVAALLKVRPDATYLLLQRTLMLEAALEQAQAQVAQLQSRVSALTREMPGVTSGEVSGRGAVSPLPVPVPAPAFAAPAAAQPPLSPSPAGGFLRNAATVGAGVLGGSLLFQGIESMLHGGGWVGGRSAPAEIFETTNNFISPVAGSGGVLPGQGGAFDDGLLADASDMSADIDTDNGLF
jgi:hypothetical protein